MICDHACLTGTHSQTRRCFRIIWCVQGSQVLSVSHSIQLLDFVCLFVRCAISSSSTRRRTNLTKKIDVLVRSSATVVACICASQTRHNGSILLDNFHSPGWPTSHTHGTARHGTHTHTACPRPACRTTHSPTVGVCAMPASDWLLQSLLYPFVDGIAWYM